jgi:1-acyl-sn-glycerol-3-phosphate acyltransferase
VRRFFSILFWLFLALSSMVLFFVALAIFLVTFPFDRNRKVLHLFSCFWAQLYFYVNPLWRLRVEGRERLPWRGPAVIVANHQSLGDILVLFGLYRPFKWVSKASVFKAPFLGWNMRLNGYVPLVRGDKESIAEMMRRCEEWLDRGVPILMFPEGTRSPDGVIKVFKDGAFRLAITKKCPVIPVLLSGTANTLPKHGVVLDARADCEVRVLDPVDPSAFGGDVAALREHVWNTLVEELARVQGMPPPTKLPVASAPPSMEPSAS